MTTMTSTRTADGATGPLGRMVDGIATRLRRYRTFRRCVSELSALSNRELSDLGMNRSMIRSVAYEEAYRTM
ncbi:DUF1127 domain-containing protein [Pseudooceanicola nanhaiensis]|uniref:DUF1127 domain-containing protein n=1 Tax=Pseudooceanicola nanhaiensis TaxID=375761 RepID=UPI001CD22C9E|nr:DUF1127 domain-containing protein [Pseudooceanicola nanhaiensis]MCA0920100.1 DUF1127 domain-containing protein [Pseudooceanicola nanhaiensis]